jgi:DNA-binding beta-propeller fold protein YncE
VDPENLKVLDWIQLPENIIGRVTTAVFEGRKFAYVSGAEKLYRYEWDGNKLAQDPDWGPVTYVKPGQTIAGAAVVMNDWVTISTNGNPATVPMTVLAISQADDSRIARIDPMPSLKSGKYSYYYAHVTDDPENNRIYVMDAGQGTASAIDLRNGKLSLAWQVKQRSNSYMTLIGPKDKRVFVAPNFKTDNPADAGDPAKLNPGPEDANYTEQIQWRDAETGKLLAASDFYSPAATGAQVPPGYGGMIYNLLNDGRIVPLYVYPKE